MNFLPVDKMNLKGTGFMEMDFERIQYFFSKGLPVALPTETVYGLAAPIDNDAAIEKIYELKGRPKSNPLIVHVGSIAQAKLLCEDWSEDADRLAKHFWPGPLTLLLKKNPSQVSDLVTAGSQWVAIRMPNHPIFLQIIDSIGSAVVAPSANPSNAVSPTRFEHVRDYFGAQVFVVDGGPCQVGIESTILEIRGDQFFIRRAGSITALSLQSVLGKQVHSRALQDGSHDTPGMSPIHYAPRKLFYRVEESDLNVFLEENPAGLLEIDLNRKVGDVEHSLYSELILADKDPRVSVLYVKWTGPIQSSEAWAGVRDRITRATQLFSPKTK